MTTPTSVQNARALVEKIARDHGYLGEDKLCQIEPELRREIEEAFLKKDLMIGSTVITLAKNLYSSKARFVFELLQNADDNLYARANESGSAPYVSFRVYPDKIILECNEDGFTHANLEAICSVGKSSKTGAQGYIGEKGIGFKSVFMAAWKVHIQSGSFSFSFNHRDGDSGMGMISPIWEDTEEVLASPLTRITLHLHTAGDRDVLARTRMTIREQFEELQENMLLFLKNLRKIDVAFFGENEERTSSATYSIDRPQVNHAVLKRTRRANGPSESQVRHFHVTTYEATNLAKNENRTYSDREEATRAYSKSQIVLAFPLSETSVPIIEPQDIFVFLPVRPVGFTFLIQADFVTDASRQDIVKDSLRNQNLLDGIATAFVTAVLQFCEHDSLRYKWMRYLPDKKDKNWNSLWSTLVYKIVELLGKTCVLSAEGNPGLRRIKDLVRLCSNTLDEDGKPLFDDGNPRQIVSTHYTVKDMDLLTDYGLTYVNWGHLIQWLRNDLERGSESRIKSSNTSDSWHTRAAQLLCSPFDSKFADEIAKLKQMDLLPLEDGTWVPASSGPVYSGESEGIDIPPGTDLRLLSRKVTNSSRKTLFRHLGVAEAPITIVRQSILRSYAPSTVAESKPSLETSKRHLEFLYLTHHLKGNNEPSYYLAKLLLYDSKGLLAQPWLRTNGIYLVDDKPYGAVELFRKTNPGSNPGDGAPGYPANFVNEEYFRNSPQTPSTQRLTWRKWFYKELDIYDIVKFEDEWLWGGAEYLQEYRPEKFIECLRIWFEKHEYFEEKLVEVLRETKVLCRGNRMILLKNVYFPVQELESRVARFVEPGAFFPWLWLDVEACYDAVPPEWKGLLAELKFGSPPTDLDFALDMLKYSLDTFPDTVTSTNRSRLFCLYEHIYNKYREGILQTEARKKIRYVRVFLPNNRGAWAFPNDCVWDAAQILKSKFALELLYAPGLRMDGSNLSYFAQFFTEVVGVTGCTWATYVDELKVLKSSNCDDIDTISGIYKAIDALRPSIIDTDKEKLKTVFEEHALIYLPSDDEYPWHKTSRCVWSSAARLRDRVSLNDDYENLQALFVDFLGVKPVDLSMAIDELKEAGGRVSTSVQEMKESIWTVNSLLLTGSKIPPSQQIRNSCVFPIRHTNGSVKCGSTTTEFFVVDREPLRERFGSMVKFLDFNLEEVARLRPFLEWTQLEAKYLSNCVKEITSFSGGVARPTLNENRQLRNRAYALLRVASHFGSPRLRIKRDMDSLYEILRGAEIYETDGISSDLVVSQDGDQHVAEGKKTTLHIDDQSGLKIYLPRHKDSQEYIFTGLLPRKLFEWMMRNPTTLISEAISDQGVNAMRSVILAPRSIIDMALDDNGIAPIELENLDAEALSEPDSPATPRRASEENSVASTPSDQADSDSEVYSTLASSVASPEVSGRSADALSRNGYFSRPRHHLTSANSSHLLSPSSSPNPARSTQVGTTDGQYRDLLTKVISTARRSPLPTYGEPDTSRSEAILSSPNNSADWGLRSLSQIERDCKVGAAGELYVCWFNTRIPFLG
ncbi:hypothetical protein GQ53DRAFT_707485 [Thozetella sp. PMI_491]|nr:hypothetical protein GQ53DRAFT_707485 [Thozetella sp. PMI_491]